MIFIEREIIVVRLLAEYHGNNVDRGRLGNAVYPELSGINITNEYLTSGENSTNFSGST
jgi:hypothetical protein